MTFVFLTDFVVSAAAFEQMRADLSGSGWEITPADYGTHERRFQAVPPAGTTAAQADALAGRVLRDCGVVAQVRYFCK